LLRNSPFTPASSRREADRNVPEAIAAGWISDPSPATTVDWREAVK
jgi:hypothetical protein